MKLRTQKIRHFDFVKMRQLTFATFTHLLFFKYVSAFKNMCHHAYTYIRIRTEYTYYANILFIEFVLLLSEIVNSVAFNKVGSSVLFI